MKGFSLMRLTELFIRLTELFIRLTHSVNRDSVDRDPVKRQARTALNVERDSAVRLTGFG